MEGPAGDPREELIGDLFGRLVEDGRTYAEAELALLKAIAEYRAQRAGRALPALAAGAVLLVSRYHSAGDRSGYRPFAIPSPFLAGLLVAAALAAGGWFLIDRGLTGMKGLGRDKAEQEAIDKGLAAMKLAEVAEAKRAALRAKDRFSTALWPRHSTASAPAILPRRPGMGSRTRARTWPKAPCRR